MTVTFIVNVGRAVSEQRQKLSVYSMRNAGNGCMKPVRHMCSWITHAEGMKRKRKREKRAETNEEAYCDISPTAEKSFVVIVPKVKELFNKEINDFISFKQFHFRYLWTSFKNHGIPQLLFIVKFYFMGFCTRSRNV